MKNSKLILLLLLAGIFSTPIVAQPPATSMADLMRSDGRIYVVIAVMLTILAGLIFYLLRLDRKISKIEKEN